jgi:hypothetical protein
MEMLDLRKYKQRSSFQLVVALRSHPYGTWTLTPRILHFSASSAYFNLEHRYVQKKKNLEHRSYRMMQDSIATKYSGLINMPRPDVMFLRYHDTTELIKITMIAVGAWLRGSVGAMLPPRVNPYSYRSSPLLHVDRERAVDGSRRWLGTKDHKTGRRCTCTYVLNRLSDTYRRDLDSSIDRDLRSLESHLPVG